MKKTVKILSAVLTAFLAIAALFNFSLFIKAKVTNQPCATILGFGSAVVVSGSMEPEISIYDLVIIHKQSAYKKGDVVTYISGNSAVTHRIIDLRVDETGASFVKTKGDFNNISDIEFPVEQIVGKVIFTIPGFGRLQTPMGVVFVTLLAAAFLAIPELILDLKNGNNRKKRK